MKHKLLHTFYSVIMTISVPLALLRLLWKSQKNPDYRRRFGERLARVSVDGSIDIWIHTVSVGEFLATLPLIQHLLTQNYRLLVTTTTPTGSAMLKQRLGDQVNHCYLPFDVPFLVRKFLHRTQPSIAVFVETEIWANYLHELRQHQIPTLLINARLSEKSFRSYAKLGDFTRQTLTGFAEIACQNQASQKRFQQLGANTSSLGNLKFDLSPPERLSDKQTELTTVLGRKPFILAASTHKGEDEIILNAFQNSHYANTHRLVIAPRHPERSADIVTLCQNNRCQTALYSQITTTLTTDTAVLIIDTLGELLYFYSLADFAVIGGSLVPHGGHNPLEAALFSTPCLIGKHYFNFESLINEMSSEDAIIITDAKQLFSPRNHLTTIGENAQRFLLNNQGALERYAQLIKTTMRT